MNGDTDTGSMDFGIDINEMVAQRLATQTKKTVHLKELLRDTKFTKEEIKNMYRGFKQECPGGIVQEDTFKEIYAKFFPHGNSALYAHHVFKAFDTNRNGSISFRDMLVSLSTLLRGTTHEKLRWTFTLYDLNGDGFITKQEVLNVMVAVHDLMGFHGTPMREVVEPNVDEIFNRLDTNRDGVVTIDEFIHACQTDPTISCSLQNFDSRLWYLPTNQPTLNLNRKQETKTIICAVVVVPFLSQPFASCLTSNFSDVLSLSFLSFIKHHQRTIVRGCSIFFGDE